MCELRQRYKWEPVFYHVKETPHLDGKHVVFGKMVSGIGVLSKISSISTDAKDRPLPSQTVRIEDCGVLGGGSTAVPSKPTGGDGQKDRKSNIAGLILESMDLQIKR